MPLNFLPTPSKYILECKRVQKEHQEKLIPIGNMYCIVLCHHIDVWCKVLQNQGVYRNYCTSNNTNLTHRHRRYLLPIETFKWFLYSYSNQIQSKILQSNRLPCNLLTVSHWTGSPKN